jgi:hypothetical protein
MATNLMIIHVAKCVSFYEMHVKKLSDNKLVPRSKHTAFTSQNFKSVEGGKSPFVVRVYETDNALVGTAQHRRS